MKLALGACRLVWHGESSLLGEGSIQKPGNDGKIASLVVGRQDDGVFIFGRHVAQEVCEEVKESNVQLKSRRKSIGKGVSY